MLTLRIAPPRMLARTAPGAGDGAGDDRGDDRSDDRGDLAGYYFGQLWCHWRMTDRALAIILAAVSAARWPIGGGGAAPWRNGWGAREQRLVRGATGGEAHLGMAARKGVHRLLNPGAFPRAANPLKNKRLFATRCRAAGLPVPDTFADDGDAAALPAWLARQAAIIAKPNYSSKGQGIVRYLRADGGWHDGTRALATEALVARLGRGGVIQTCLAGHADLAALSPGALPTLRIMTCLDEQGAVEQCGVLLRLGAGRAPVDNFNAGNLVAAVGDDGRLGPAFIRAGAAIETVTHHPATGAEIVGRRVPDLAAAIDLAVAAHAVFRNGFTVIGWDIGLAEGGPVLIEGNWNPGTDVVQLVAGRGLGRTRLGALYRHHLARLPAARWRAARPIEREPRHAR
ncbi:sugar-transfer associated ATP-grasp domain-containing protein [Sphingomonas profundi]|uniref:sugar-transfer associated ATP-grasp domain-containing protein n=1 Tax=Alterirhizorhabdus profundi TaxID=2681549 RepID=UPI001E4FE191|nr:sugar-transfer associated ATP-grasp domain-containing protein [Sphingomonas profundi]